MSEQVNAELRRAIEKLYETFAPYPLPLDTDPCPCCHSPADEAILHSKLLRELSIADLNSYIFDALLTWGDAATFKHLLPRIFELYLTAPDGEVWYVDPEIVFKKFWHAGWWAWPDEEKAVVRALLHEVWAMVIVESLPNIFADVDSGLCTIAQADEDLSPYLDQWLRDQSQESSKSLAAFILTSAIVLRGGSGRDAFWDERDEQYRQVERWVKSAAVSARLKRALNHAGSPELGGAYTAALQMLEAPEVI